MNPHQAEKNWYKSPLFLRVIAVGRPYFVKTPWFLKMLWPSYVWSIDTSERIIYLSFDDGPHPVATPFVLDELKQYDAKATFFCIGENVITYPEIYRRVLNEGHAVGNHTQHHLNGWKCGDEVYLNDVAEATKHIDSALFRPPYGRIRRFQARNLRHAIKSHVPKIIMWSVLSGDFDQSISEMKCLENVIGFAKPGSIVVFHDSEKAFPRLRHALPLCLRYFSEKGYRFEGLS